MLTRSPRPADIVAPVDMLWRTIRAEAAEIVRNEPVLAGLVAATVLEQSSLEWSVVHRIASRLDHPALPADALRPALGEVLRRAPWLGDAFRQDLAAVAERDPACQRLIEPLLHFKGFQALATHRFAHELWQAGRVDLALYLQSRTSGALGVDIHPAAKVGRGIMFDHATGIVIGETAEIGDGTSLLHAVTLGGSGKETGDRHPKIGRGVMIGAGAKVLGNIRVGDCSRIAAGSVVLQDVPPKTTVAGVPARIVGEAGCAEPARRMDQMILQARDGDDDER